MLTQRFFCVLPVLFICISNTLDLLGVGNSYKAAFEKLSEVIQYNTEHNGLCHLFYSNLDHPDCLIFYRCYCINIFISYTLGNTQNPSVSLHLFFTI